MSFWADFTAHNILPWIDKNYKILIDAGMKISRIPFIQGFDRYSSLLSLGKITANTGFAYTYCIWEGTAVELQRDLTAVKLKMYSTDGSIKPENDNLNEVVESIDTQISLIKTRLNDQKPSVPIMESSLCHNKLSYTPEDIIAKLGRKEAAALAQAILNKLLE